MCIRDSDKGVGNGISLIIFAGIVARIPSGIRSLVTSIQAGTISIITLIILVIVAILVIAGVVMIQEGQRRIPVPVSYTHPDVYKRQKLLRAEL